MKLEKIKPIPKYLIERIKKADKERYPTPNGNTRFYSYLTTNDKELVKVTVAVRHKNKKWYYKQCAVHGVHSEECFVKDMVFAIVGGYCAGWYAEGLTKYPKWYERENWQIADDTYFDAYAPCINKEYISKFPEYKYSAFELYNDVDILQYLRLYEKYPQTEFLVKFGLEKYVKSKQILEKVQKDKKFRKWLCLNRSELSANPYYISVIMQAYKKNKPLKELQHYEVVKKALCKDITLKPIREMLGGNYEEYVKYITKQKISNRLYLDYLNACNHLGLDMNENKNRFPHDFMYWHDVRIDEYATAKALKDKEERKELYSKFAVTANKYMPLQYDKKGDFVVMIAKSPADLIREGEMLHHCVGGMHYDQKFIREETLILFVRSRENPDMPFVTVEYSIEQKKILQCYASRNTQPSEKVQQYVNKIWLPYANRTLKKIAA